MFLKACALASAFTRPVVTSIKTKSGKCSSGIGTYVIVNEEGWIVTAAHIVQQMIDISRAHKEAKDRIDNRHTRRANKSVEIIEHHSTWWGASGSDVDGGFYMDPSVDLAVGKLKGFQPASNQGYPAFKNPEKDFEVGRSLCRMGYPFYDVGTIWNDAKGVFELTKVPCPIFPHEGILSRIQERIMVDENDVEQAAEYPKRMIETSNAGIRGQSGGPIFDVHGAIWGIQSATISYAMDLNTTEKQYYHVGLGISSATIAGVFNKLGVKYTLSNH